MNISAFAERTVLEEWIDETCVCKKLFKLKLTWQVNCHRFDRILIILSIVRGCWLTWP